ncbi:MAG: YihA family ribosome biogenesis GTP-binding protein [Lachnospiraceae bacterium]|nr:YihA family ribosome biogenesis GTP-binding protein [Lachnospiraceae bacterium]
MKIKKAELETVCGPTSKLPHNTQPEVAFTGKSNVGKSSLINSLMNRKSLARTSAQPGKTQTLNFYHLNDEIYLVDLPGYGYAKSSKVEREKWGEMIERYITSSEQLEVVFLLIDIRHDPTKNDVEMYEWLKYMEMQTIVIATKSDKLKKHQIQQSVKNIEKCLHAEEDDLIIVPYSSVTKEGREEIWDFMDQILEQ